MRISIWGVGFSRLPEFLIRKREVFEKISEAIDCITEQIELRAHVYENPRGTLERSLV